MPRAERGTPKDIANRAKAKGLQKLRWYCQMCQKQCRDENGMKCHMTSESHLRQMKIFSQNAGSIMDSFSREFEKVYLDTLRRRHGTTRMNANNVYQEVIQDKHHIHMNSTMWATLSDFVQYLGKKGKCVVDETERGWYVQFIERDPFLLERQEAAERRAEAERIQEIKTIKRMEQQRAEAAAALDRAGGVLSVEASKMDRSNLGSISISLGAIKSKTNTLIGKNPSKTSGDSYEVDKKRLLENSLGDECISAKETKRVKDTDTSRKSKKPLSALEQIMLENEMNAKREKYKSEQDKDKIVNIKHDTEEIKDRRKEHWIREGIVVRIISKKLAKKSYYKQKGIILEVKDKFIATILLDGEDHGTSITVDQRDLETVIPKVGHEVLIVNGKGRGREAIIESLDKSNYKAVVTLLSGSKQTLKNIDYEDISELA